MELNKTSCTRIILLFFLVFISVSCTKEVDFKATNESDLFVVNSLITPDEEIQMFLNKTMAITDSLWDPVYYSSIHLYENNARLTFSIEKVNSYYILHYKPHPEKKYRIEINFPSFEKTVIAEDSIPSLVQLENATYRYPASQDQYETWFGDLKITFADEKDVTNYYEIVMLDNDSRLLRTFNINSPVITVNTDKDPVMLPSLLFTDEKFRDTILVLDVFVESYQSPLVLLRNVSYNYYQYKKNLYQHLNNQNTGRDDIYDIFKGDPLDLFSNITNGLGIFAGYSEVRLKSVIVE